MVSNVSMQLYVIALLNLYEMNNTITFYVTPYDNSPYFSIEPIYW